MIGVGHGEISLMRLKKTIVDDREYAIVAAYRGGNSLRVIGDEHGVTYERVRQLIVHYEELTGDVVVRHPKGVCGLRKSRVVWRCADCGVERMVTQIKSDRCWACYIDHVRTPPKTVECWLMSRREGHSWNSIAVACSKATNDVMLSTLFYLRARGRLDEVPKYYGKMGWMKRYGINIVVALFLVILLPSFVNAQEPSERTECLRDRAYEWFTSSKPPTQSNEQFAVLSAAMACGARPDEAVSTFTDVAEDIRSMGLRPDEDLREYLIKQHRDET